MNVEGNIESVPEILRELLQRHYSVFYRLGVQSVPQEPIAALTSVDRITDLLVL